MLHLVTFGGLVLESVNEAVAPRLSAQRLAILAVLAAEGDRRVTRERLTGLFWPEADEERARHSLRQALYVLRHEIGREVVRSDVALSLDASAITSDVSSFRAALARGDAAAAGELIRGPFLDGFYLPSAGAFQRWVEDERARLHAQATRVIAALASDACTAKDLDTAIGWRRRLTELQPLSGRYAFDYLTALGARGDRAEALAFARAHTALVRRELETEPDADVVRLEASLRSQATPAVRVAATVPSPATAPAPLEAMREDPSAGTVSSAHRTVGRPQGHARRLTRVGVAVAAAVVCIAIGRSLVWRPPGNARAAETLPTLAVGLFRDDRADSARVGAVMTDMLSTNLARVTGLRVIANSRLLSLISPGQDTSALAYWDAARRAGATELVEGHIVHASAESVTVQVQRVDLQSGIVRAAYRTSARSHFRIVDSLTAIIARQLELSGPRASLADVTTRSATAYRLYQEGLRAYYVTDGITAQRLMRAALEDDSTFAMAAYYDVLLTDDGQNRALMDRALRLAQNAADRDRLLITADLLNRSQSPRALAFAESLATRLPNDPRATETLARARHYTGDWAGAAQAFERALALDSAAREARDPCHACEDLLALADTYFWWDSIPAAMRVGERFRRQYPRAPRGWEIALWSAAKLGDTAAATVAFRHYIELSPNPKSAPFDVRHKLMVEQYDAAAAVIRPLLQSPSLDDVGGGRWWMLIALRNQGRLREAEAFNRTGRLAGMAPPQVQPPQPDEINRAMVALESGDAQTAVAAFTRWRGRMNPSGWAPGFAARNLAWSGTLIGMALVATGDTEAVSRMADTVEYWGKQSLFGRDQKAHHYLRGMTLAASGRDDDAITELRRAIYSSTLGFTRVNFELGRLLLRRNRPADAVMVLQPALRGEIDASNLYVTRTELHELLAQAYDRVGLPDSAATHYRAVASAWANADEMFHARRDSARAWVARHDRGR